MTQPWKFVVLGLMLGACNNGADKTAPTSEPVQATPSPATVTVELGKIGYQIHTPAAWKVKELSELYSFRLPSTTQDGVTVVHQLSVFRRPVAQRKLAEMVKACGGTLLDSSDGPARYFTCEQVAMGQTIQTLEYVLAAGENASIHCTGSGSDLEPLLAACKTLTPH